MTLFDAMLEAQRRAGFPVDRQAKKHKAPPGAFTEIIPGREEQTILAYVKMIEKARLTDKVSTRDIVTTTLDATTDETKN